MNRILSAVFYFFIFPAISSPLFSQDSPPSGIPGYWWLKSPFEAVDTLGQTLFKAEGNLSFNNSTGNYEAHSIYTGILGALRKGFVTGYIELNYNKQKAKMGGGETSMYTFLFRPHINWDMLPFLHVEAGLLWEKNPLHMMENQYLPYAGLGTRWSITAAHQLNFFIAGGRAFPTYTVPLSYFGMGEGPYDGMYVSEIYNFVINKQFSVTQSVVHMRNLNEMKRYTTNVSLNFLAAAFRFISLTMGYTYSLSTEAGFVGASDVDTGQSMGIQVQL